METQFQQELKDFKQFVYQVESDQQQKYIVSFQNSKLNNKLFCLNVKAFNFYDRIFEQNFDFDYLQNVKKKIGLQCNYGQLFDYIKQSLFKPKNTNIILIDDQNFHFKQELDVFNKTKFGLDFQLTRGENQTSKQIQEQCFQLFNNMFTQIQLLSNNQKEQINNTGEQNGDTQSKGHYKKTSKLRGDLINPNKKKLLNKGITFQQDPQSVLSSYLFVNKKEEESS